MDTEEKLALMAEIKQTIVDYLQDEVKINTDALKAYEGDQTIQDQDATIRRMRETEAIKLRDRIYELNRHIAVIKRMFPTP